MGIKFLGVLNFGFGRDVRSQNLKADPYKYQFFKKSDPFIYQLVQFWGPNFEQNHPIFPKFS